MFNKPKLSLLLQIYSPVCYNDARASVLSELVVKMVKDELNEFSYTAEMAGLNYVMQVGGGSGPLVEDPSRMTTPVWSTSLEVN